MKRSMSRRHFFFFALAASASLYGCSRSKELSDIHGIDMADTDIGRDFLLTGTDGRQHRLSDFKGKAVLIFFGFTQCPDVCPTALFRAAEVKKLLGEDGERLQTLFITVDPERDTPEVLDAYVTAFDPSFLGLYGDLEQTAKTARDFKVFYQKVPTGSSYTMDHTAMTYVYDRDGRLRLGLRHSLTAQEYAEDIRQILALD
ncbi:SCO family protein [Pollutimonas bauzanensis]|uniref:Protein SCO1/2 n=1 Tax=Pollutimonas bauzanensis TaxID=658167 RepID=A0A1M5ZMT7_9BURK|nr:SCO family protein [Pollutimonas bauzanensis]SHI25504.1 protein SCO1/2 [Pollutimonas bauzanensis]